MHMLPSAMYTPPIGNAVHTLPNAMGLSTQHDTATATTATATTAIATTATTAGAVATGTSTGTLSKQLFLKKVTATAMAHKPWHVTHQQ